VHATAIGAVLEHPVPESFVSANQNVGMESSDKDCTLPNSLVPFWAVVNSMAISQRNFLVIARGDATMRMGEWRLLPRSESDFTPVVTLM
jgi:hypothetical protein